MTLLKLTAAQSLRTPTVNPYAGEPIANWESYANISPQASNGGDQASGEDNSNPPTYIYSSFGVVRPVFPSLSIEKEFYQIAPPDSPTPPSKELLFEVVSQTENLYLARQLCWVLTIAQIDSYILEPTSEAQLLYLIAAIRQVQNPLNQPVITAIGSLGKMAPSGACNGLELPIVSASKLSYVSPNQFIRAIVEELDSSSEENALTVVGKLWSLAINPGNTEKYRALNFVLTDYLDVYLESYKLLYPTNTSDPTYELTGIRTTPALLQGNQKIYNVIFSYQPTSTGVSKEKYCQVDVTTEFPYIVMPFADYIASYN
ncbi:MAG: hypothetical protein F6J93_08665 [Oscillatoria sp. SIO1A7]|nr:hypothetical protein [Oscillatoria sp. SIO1A7]